jgi:Ankyrin repeats (3 copies)/Ankyrin repeat
MATELLSCAEAGPWREDKVAPGERGISLHWLCDFVQDKLATVNEPRWLAIEQGDRARAHNEAGRWGRHDLPDMEVPEVPPLYFLNTHAIVSQVIIPLTREIGGPLFALVPPEHRGPPTTFISHTWNSLLIGPSRQRIGTLDAVYREKDEFVWIDFACYTQPPVDNTDISADMFDIIKKIGKVIVAVTPTPLYSRSWCLWELYSADVSELTLDFRVCTGFRNDKIQSVNALYRSFSGVENARSINARAEAQIRDAFIRRHGSAEQANTAVKAMLTRQLGARWHELQPDDGPLKFSADPWAADPDGATLRAYDPYWEPGLLDCVIYGGTETVREVFARAGVYTGEQETATLSARTSDPANLRLIDALQNEDAASIMSVAYKPTVDLNQPLPFRGVLTFEMAPPLHFLMPWAARRTIDVVLLAGADVNLPWTFPPETQSTDATERTGLVRALLNGVGDPMLAAWTPLMLGVLRGDAAICAWIIECGAHALYACPRTGLTALHLAAAGKRKDLVELLIQHGATTDAPLVSAITALHIAAIVGDVDSITLLLKSGANRGLRDRTGQTALEWARRNNHTSAAELLERLP